MFYYVEAYNIMNDNHEPQFVIDCQNMQTKLNSLNKRMVFGPIILTLGVVKQLAIYVSLYGKEMKLMRS